MALHPSALQMRLSSPLLHAFLILAAVVVLMLVATAIFGVSSIERPDVLTPDPAGLLPF